MYLEITFIWHKHNERKTPNKTVTYTDVAYTLLNNDLSHIQLEQDIIY